MNIPKNGRIAIIDDDINQALPLINLLSKNEMPHSYFSGNLEYLPKAEERTNDIRILFLDINLLGNSAVPIKNIKATLIAVLKRVISKSNFPYVIIYWSKHEDEYKTLIEEDIFVNDLKDRRPIGFLSLNKIDFFDLEGKSKQATRRLESIIDNVNTLIGQDLAHSYLIQWENMVHYSSDCALQEIFSFYHDYESWPDNANYIIDNLGKSYSGNSFKDLGKEDKIKSAYQTLNNVFLDSLETSTSQSSLHNPQDLTIDSSKVNKETIYTINRKLLTSSSINDNLKYPGTVIKNSDPSSNKPFSTLLNDVFDRFSVTIDAADESSQKREREKKAKKIRRKIRETWKKIYVVVTPLCDYVQCKSKFTRLVQGVMIESKYLCHLNNHSEAVFISPAFTVDDKTYIIVLNFRYFFTANRCPKEDYLSPLFRFRQEMLSEIQSKLARHINRQGILFLE